MVPYAVVDELVVPLALAGLQIDGDERLGKQIVARAIGAKIVAGRALNRKICDLQLRVDADLSPGARIAGVGPRVFQPRFVAKLAGLWNRVEDPQPLARAHVESANVAFHVRLTRGNAARPMSGADDDDVAGHHRRRVESDLARHRIDLLIVVLLEVDDAVFAEGRHAHSRLCVQGDKPVSRGDVEDSFFLAVGPVREAAPRKQPRRRGATWAFALAVHPELFAGLGIERDDGPAAAGRRIQHAVGHHRRRLEHELGTRAEVIGLEAPRHGELAEIRGVDLIERRITRVSGVAAVGAPLAVERAGLAVENGGGRDADRNRDNSSEQPERHQSAHETLPSGRCEYFLFIVPR